MRKPLLIVALVALLCLAVLADKKHFTPPPVTPARTFAAHEAHDNEKAVLAVDPYDTPEKASIFVIKYKDYGFLPIRFIISNDGDQPLMLNDLTIQYITADRQKLEPATRDDLLRRLIRPDRPAQPQPRLPIPIPGEKGRKQPISDQAREEIDLAQFPLVPVMPHSTSAGFLFFDVAGIHDWRTGSHIAISGIKSGEKELFYFDIPVEKVLATPK